MAWLGLLIIIIAGWAIYRMLPRSSREIPASLLSAPKETSSVAAADGEGRSRLIPFLMKGVLGFVVLVIAFQIRTCSDKAETMAAQRQAEQARQAADSRKSKIEAAIAAQKVMIGMSADEVKRSWGLPSKVNRTINAAGTSEQWVYYWGSYGNAGYVYLNDGVVTTIQAP